MECRYCGSDNPASSLRCGKCQRRLPGPAAYRAPETYPITTTAAVPAMEELLQAMAEPAAGISPVAGNPHVQPRGTAVQRPLFSYRDPRQPIPFGLEPERIEEPPRAEKKAKPAGRRTPEGQAAFRFDAPPEKPLSREYDVRKTPLRVAPLVVRAGAALFDAALIVALSGLVVTAMWWTLSNSMASGAALPYYAAAPVFIAIFYKCIWCVAGQSTIGIQGTRLRLVSFDGQTPTQTQRVVRLVASWFSVGAGGIGLLWAIGDQEKLTWHDHISQTFLTRDEKTH